MSFYHKNHLRKIRTGLIIGVTINSAREGLFKDIKFMDTESEKGIKGYFVNSFRELTKITWPTKNQAITMSIVVVVFIFISAFFIAGGDFGFNELYTYFLSVIR